MLIVEWLTTIREIFVGGKIDALDIARNASSELAHTYIVRQFSDYLYILVYTCITN